MRLRRPAGLSFAAALASLVVSAVSGRAAALETPNVGGKPVVIDITNTAVTTYHFNNRNDSDINPPTQVDDNYGEFLDRLNVQASWWRFRAGVRMDTAVYFHTLDRSGVAALVHDQTPVINAAATPTDPPAGVANSVTNNFYDELHSRFLRAIYPSKLFAGYAAPGIDITVGDFYVQLGRGLVFSVRKIDELAVDTTVRGAKVELDHQIGEVQIGAMLFGGQMNPLRVDEASGRRLNGSGSPLFFGFPGGGNLETYSFSGPNGAPVDNITLGRPSYLEDSALGGKLDVGTKWFTLGANAAGLYRQSNTVQNLACLRSFGGTDTTTMGGMSVQGICGARYPEFSSTDPSKEHNRILNWSGSINVPSIAKHGDLYVEVAGQSMRDGHLAVSQGHLQPQPNLDGYAVYASGSITSGPVSISLEGKHYRNFFPLSANIDISTPGFSAPEFSLVSYSQPPTAEPTYTEVVSGGSPGVCITGGRGRIDYRFNREASVYAWLGRYTSWSETPGQDLGNGCTIAPSRLNMSNGTSTLVAVQTNIWDMASGVELGFEKGRTHVKAWVGVRTSDTAIAQQVQGEPAPDTAFYREGYLRYDIVKHLTGPFSLQLQGFHRHRWEPVSFIGPWNEGENYTALQWSPHWSAIIGYEYLAKTGCEPERSATLTQAARAKQDLCNYVNGGIQWRAGSAGEDRPATKYVAHLFDAVNVFVGERRGATRCVSGVCRQFPPFEGARLEITSRF